MGLGLVLGALAGAGNAVSQSAGENQKFADNEEAARNREAADARMAQTRADLQVEMSKRIAENNVAIADAPLKRYSEVAQRYANTDTPALPAPTTTSTPTGVVPGAVSGHNGFQNGSYDEIRARILSSGMPQEDIDGSLKQLDAQFKGDTDAATPHKLTGVEATRAALRELKVTDPRAYQAAKEALKNQLIHMGQGSAMFDEDEGKVVYQNDTARQIAEIKANALTMKSDKEIQAKERMNEMKLNAAAAKNAVDPNDVETAAHGIAGYLEKPLTSRVRSTPFGVAVMNRVSELKPDWDEKEYGQMDKAVKSFGTGKEGGMVRSFNVAIDHISTAEGLIDALANGDTPAINKLSNYLSKQTGSSAVTDFDSVKQIVAAEIVKAVVGGTAAKADREEIAHQILSSNSPEQLHGALTQFKALMRGQLDGLRDQYERTTGRDDFDDKLLSKAARAVSNGEGGEFSRAPVRAAAPVVVAPGLPKPTTTAPDGWGELKIH